MNNLPDVQWEYIEEYCDHLGIKRSLTDLGKAGWELCGILPSLTGSDSHGWPSVVRLYFKRVRK